MRLGLNISMELKLQSMHSKHATSLTQVKFHKIASAGKITASVFCDIEKVMIIDYLVLRESQDCHGCLMRRVNNKLCAVIKGKRPGKLRAASSRQRNSEPLFPWPLFPSTDSKCCILYILQTCLHLTFICSYLCKIHLAGRHLRAMKISQMLKMADLNSWMKSSWMIYKKHLNIAGKKCVALNRVYIKNYKAILIAVCYF